MTTVSALPQRIEGDVGSMAWWSGQFTRVQDRLEDLRDAVARASTVSGAGESVSAVRDDAERLLTTIDADIGEAALLAIVLQDYADAHERHAQRANALVEDIEMAEADWMQRSEDAADAAGVALVVAGAGVGLFTDLAQNAATEAAQARDLSWQHLSALRSEYERHFENWDAAYDEALAALAGGASASLTPEARAVFERLLGADDSAEVLALWNAHPELHDELLDARPDLLGNLDGIPYIDRSAANESVLRALYDSDLEEPLRSEVDALYSEVVFNDARLISFDASGSEQATAALWYGEFDAHRISVLVPGMNSNVAGIGEWGVSAGDINGAVPDSATIVWFGYDSPSVLEEPGMHRAEDGAAAFTGFLNGLDELAPSAELNVVSHSYGSTMSALAIGSQPDGLGVDRFITVGSAGLPNDEAILDNLQSSSAPAIFATMADGDVWAPIGQLTAFGHNTSPTQLDGVTVFDSDGGVTSAGDVLIATPGHAAHEGANSLWWDADDAPGGYLLDGSESFYNVQQIIATGAPGTEAGGEGSAPDWSLYYSGGYYPYGSGW